MLSGIIIHGEKVARKDVKRNIKELVSYKFELQNPRDRLLFDETRPLNIFQCIGHFLWITQGNFNLEAIEYYVPRAKDYSSDGIKVIGAYGPRLFGIQHLNQMEHILRVLDEDPSKRRAVASVYLPQFDQHGLPHEEIPCTLNLQYLIRQNQVQSVIYMRSQDALKVLPYDLFIFTMLQEYVQNRLKPKYDQFELGKYNHFSGSFHVYETDLDVAKKIVSNTKTSSFQMPPMPHSKLHFKLRDMNKFESIVRTKVVAKIDHNVGFDFDSLFTMVEDFLIDPYWKQFGYLLLCYGAFKVKDSTNEEKALQLLDENYKRLAVLNLNLFKKKFQNIV